MNVLVEEQCLKDIANAIRKKNGKTRTYKPREMALAIEGLEMQPTKKYYVYITQSDNQVITAMYNGTSYTNMFSAYENSRITFSIKANSGYTAGTLNYTVISSLNSDVTVSATQATKKVKSYKDKKAEVIKKDSFNAYCKFTDGETFTFHYLGDIGAILDNSNLANFVENNEVYLEYKGTRICTFKKEQYAKDVKNIVKEIKTGDTITVRVG